MLVKNSRPRLKLLAATLVAVSTLTSGGCARLYHLLHYNHLADVMHEHHRQFYHSPHTGRIIAKEHQSACVVEPPCFGYEATCWHRWPEECGKCPVEEVIMDRPYNEPTSVVRELPMDEPVQAPAGQNDATDGSVVPVEVDPVEVDPVPVTPSIDPVIPDVPVEAPNARRDDDANDAVAARRTVQHLRREQRRRRTEIQERVVEVGNDTKEAIGLTDDAPAPGEWDLIGHVDTSNVGVSYETKSEPEAVVETSNADATQPEAKKVPSKPAITKQEPDVPLARTADELGLTDEDRRATQLSEAVDDQLSLTVSARRNPLDRVATRMRQSSPTPNSRIAADRPRSSVSGMPKSDVATSARKKPSSSRPKPSAAAIANARRETVRNPKALNQSKQTFVAITDKKTKKSDRPIGQQQTERPATDTVVAAQTEHAPIRSFKIHAELPPPPAPIVNNVAPLRIVDKSSKAVVRFVSDKPVVKQRISEKKAAGPSLKFR